MARATTMNERASPSAPRVVGAAFPQGDQRLRTRWVVIVCRRVGNGQVVPEVLEVRDGITAERYFDKMVAGQIM